MFRPAVHRTSGDETLEMIAVKFRLRSADILRACPRNLAIRGLGDRATIPAGTVVHVPVDPIDTLRSLHRVMGRINGALRLEFDVHEDLFRAALPELFGGAASVEALRQLDTRVGIEIDRLEQACGDLNQAIDALVDGGWSEMNVCHGLAWVLTPDLLELWRTMWSPSRWEEALPDLTERHLELFFNMVRSRVLQHGECRVRESVRDVQLMESRAP